MESFLRREKIFFLSLIGTCYIPLEASRWATTKKFRVIAQLLHGLTLRLNLQWVYNRKRAQKQNTLEKNIYDDPSANLRPLFNINATKIPEVLFLP